MANIRSTILPMDHKISRRRRRGLGSGGSVDGAARGRKRYWLLWGAFALAAILGLAWYDGGEESIRPISETVAIPEGR